MQVADATQHPLVLDRSRRLLALGALEVAGRRYAQGPADRLDPEKATVFVDVAAHFGRPGSSSRAKNSGAWFHTLPSAGPRLIHRSAARIIATGLSLVGRRSMLSTLPLVSHTVALVIRCFNEEAHIGRLLTGVVRQTHVPEEIIVVDSGSTDATLAIASAFPVEIVTIAPEDFSFGRELNVGLASASTDVAVLASAHVYPLYDTWIERLTAPFATSEIAVTYGRQQTPPDGRLSERRILDQWFPARSVERQRHPFSNNANAAIRRSVWTAQYNEDLTGLEDLDWAKRALAAGQLLSYVPEAPVAQSASTMIRTSSSKVTAGSHPSLARAFAASPSSTSTSAGR